MIYYGGFNMDFVSDGRLLFRHGHFISELSSRMTADETEEDKDQKRAKCALVWEWEYAPEKLKKLYGKKFKWASIIAEDKKEDFRFFNNPEFGKTEAMYMPCPNLPGYVAVFFC